MKLIFAAPSTRIIIQNGNETRAFDLQTAVNRAEPGDTIKLISGEYFSPAVISRSGSKGKPITLIGPKDGSAVLDGRKEPTEARNDGSDPLDSDFAFLKLFHCKNIVLDSLSFRNCWPTSIYMRGVKDIAVRNCRGVGGRFFAYARQSVFARTRRLLFERNNWVQDPAHDMWDGRITWPQVKRRDPAFDASFLNGAFFASFDIDGQIVIRDCTFSHAFNAIRMDIRKRRIQKTADGPRITRNRDVAIYRNRFAFIRDNAIEPEMGAEDWRVFNNWFFNVHAAFSLDGVAGRDLVHIANRLLNNRRPGLVGQKNQSGKIIKFLGLKKDTDNRPTSPRKGVWFLFNSVQTRTSYAKESRTEDWNDAYNAVGLYSANHPEEPGAPRPVFAGMIWNDRIQITGLATDDAEFPDAYAKEGARIRGFPSVGHVFEVGDFDIDPDHPLGGWDGRLTRTAEIEQLMSRELTIERAEKPTLTLPAGLAPGAHDMQTLGLGDWDEDPPTG